jgi:hypothetical protein
MLFLRDGDITRWWGAEAHALHTMEVDTCHHAVPTEEQPDPQLMLNGQYRHCYQHIGGAQTVGDSHRAAGLSHTFCEGLADYYYLTGDTRARDQVLATARRLARFTLSPQGYVWGWGRNVGWGLLVMGAAQRIEPDELVERAAEAILQKLESLQSESGKIMRSSLHPRALEDRGVNLTVRGLIKWHQVTGCERTRRQILELMDMFVQRCIGPEGLPTQGTWPEIAKPATVSNGFANLECLAYAYELSGEQKYVEAGVGALCQAVDWILNAPKDPEDQEGQNYFMRMLRGPLPFMTIAHELGLLERVPGAGPWLRPGGRGDSRATAE